MLEQPRKYKGLANIGATCYMNSLLQTLFMTPEFRSLIYTWHYDPNTHGSEEDSILFQLQKLFTRLQSSFPTDVDPKGLIRSFQWGGEEAFEQQDIQEFNRVLIEAIEQSLRMSEQGVKQYQFLSELFQGIMMNYCKCKECGKEYPREQRFQDLMLTVKDKFQKVYNKSLEVGLQRYLKPETLSGTNQYYCESCDKKVDAERGVKLIKLPKFLPIILRRFNFDLMTMERIKINEQVTFPFVINMNNYMNGYEGIPQREAEEIFQEEAFVLPEPKKHMVIKRNFLKSSKKDTKLPNNIRNKPLPETKSFLSDMRKRTGKNKEIVIEIESGNKMVSGQALEDELLQAAINESLNQSAGSHTETVSQPSSLSYPPVNLLDLPPLPQVPPSPPDSSQSPIGPPPPALPLAPKDTVNLAEEARKRLHKICPQQRKQNDEALKDYQNQVSELKMRYLKEGSLVYQLYSIMVHSGGVNHGHYYAYIHSFEDGRWYCFNDFSVRESNINLIKQETFGGKGSTNCYVLYYRQVDEQSNTLKTPSPPQAILDLIEKEKSTFMTKQMERTKDAEKYIKLKIYYRLYVKTLEIINTSTLQECLEAAKKLFGAQLFSDILPQNIRLRMFNASTESKLQTFTDRESMTLEQLKINSHKSMLLETKKEDELFQEYSVGLTTARVVWWSQNIPSLDETALKLQKVSFPLNSTMREVQAKIKQACHTDEAICIIKRHQNDEYSYHEVINTEDYLTKTVEDLMIFENEILFVEVDAQTLKWPLRFEAEVFNVIIRYILSGDEEVTLSNTVDSRTKLQQLKEELCSKHGLDIHETILKRGNKSGMELKDLEQTLQDLRFISGTQLFIDAGIPALPGELRVILYLSKPTPLDTLNAFNTFEAICEIPVNGNKKASEVKDQFLKVLQKKTGIVLDPSRIRIRQRLPQRMTKIYREKPLRQQQLIQKRMIAIEEIPLPQQLDLKESLVYIRLFDPSEWTLGDRFELIVNRMTTMHEMALMISQIHPEIRPETIEISKVVALHKLSMLDLAEMDYCNMHQIELPVSIEPLFIINDGFIFVVKDKSKPLRELTKEESLKFGGTFKVAKGRSSTYKPPQAQKEKGVKITVKKMDVKKEEVRGDAEGEEGKMSHNVLEDNSKVTGDSRVEEEKQQD